ncbi:MAG: hypothetical protein K2Q10_10265, partial [Rhodospirillales bacterium]|nr:hypothetical protein [Rhodospirillales bacterium]
DCMRSGATVGTVRRFDVADTPLPAECMMASSHLFGVGQAVEMARLLGRLPRWMSIIGIEGRNFEYGAAVESALVAAATSMVLGDSGF